MKDKIEAIMKTIQERYDRSMDGDDLDDYDNGYRAGLLVAKNICKEVLLQEPTEERDDICLRCGVERKEVKREGSNGCYSRGFHYPKHLWK